MAIFNITGGCKCKCNSCTWLISLRISPNVDLTHTHMQHFRSKSESWQSGILQSHLIWFVKIRGSASSIWAIA